VTLASATIMSKWLSGLVPKQGCHLPHIAEASLRAISWVRELSWLRDGLAHKLVTEVQLSQDSWAWDK
jgi:hypothetical protein